jgi:beta-glucosidase
MKQLSDAPLQAQHTGIASADAGLDMVMPNSKLWSNLSTAVSNGTLSQNRLDDMATRYAP